ncbi:MAG TPA: 50S ribosome-binding GTPase [bacterium]|nr:50S ribosome-binding GTPase [bacterium]
MLFDKEQILRIIIEKPLASSAIILLYRGNVIEKKTFTSNWNLYNHLETLSVSNRFDSLLIASHKPVLLNEIKNFMDGRLVSFIGIVTHNEEKIPLEIEYFCKNGSSVKSGRSPFFLFKEPGTAQKKDPEMPAAAALFLSSSTTDYISESIKLLEDAGYLVIETKVFGKAFSTNILTSISEWVKNNSKISTVAVFFEMKAGNLSKLEKATGLEVLSREDLVISIFNSRAQGSSGKLKFAGALIAREKAQFRNKVQGLSRIKGGIGLKGPGETKEEERKRILKNKEKTVRIDLKHETERLSIQRKFREKSAIRTVAIVGYTNAGKSTLFNSLLNRKVVEESNRFFSSIDPKIQKMTFNRKEVFLIDTVGFISEMSEDIIEAFRSTFTDIASSNLILHIVDSTSKGWNRKKKFVEDLMLENGIARENIITLYSKSDLVKIKHPVANGFFYSSLKSEDILKIRNFIISFLFPDK